MDIKSFPIHNYFQALYEFLKKMVFLFCNACGRWHHASSLVAFLFKHMRWQFSFSNESQLFKILPYLNVGQGI